MWFTSRQRTRRILSSCRPRLEHLENRVVLDAGFLPPDPRGAVSLLGMIDQDPIGSLTPRDQGPQIAYDNLKRAVLVAGTPFDDTVEVNSTDYALEVRIDSPTGSARRSFAITSEPQVIKVKFFGFAGEDTFHNNTSLASYVEGGPGIDDLHGGSGSDTFHGGQERDYLYGNGGNDFLYGDGGSDIVDGGAGRDTLYWYSGDGMDILEGGNRDDVVKVFGSNRASDEFYIGSDVMRPNQLCVVIQPDSAWLSIGTVESLHVYGQGSADTFHISEMHTVDDLRSVRLYGNGGRDEFYMDDSLDFPQFSFPDWNTGSAMLPLSITVPQLYINGGSSSDWLSYDSWSSNVSVHLATGSATGASRISNIECVQGGAGYDTLTGNSAANSLCGGGGRDHLYGGGGNDYLSGGPGVDDLHGGGGHDALLGWEGTDTLEGGAGADRFLVVASQGVDTITDKGEADVSVTFQDGQDLTLELVGERYFFPGRAWSEEDIRRVDGAFAVLVNRMQSNVLLRNSQGHEMTFECYGTGTVLATGDVARIRGWNNNEGSIAFTQRMFDGSTDHDLHRTVYHEIGHNWDEEGALWNDFLAINGWTHVQPSSAEIANYTETQRDGETWWYRTESSGFARDYGNDHPVEDFATCFAMYFLQQEGLTWQLDHAGEVDSSGNLTADGQATLDSKLSTIDRLLTYLEEND